jgi:signal transduction histidine kinase/HAMP domain-containing protein
MSSFDSPELRSTGDRPALQQIQAKRPFGVRLWLALMFAAIGILCGTSVYLFVSGSSEGAAEDQSEAIASGRIASLKIEVEDKLRQLDKLNPTNRQTRNRVGPVLSEVRSESFQVWYYDASKSAVSFRKGLVTRRAPGVGDVDIGDVPDGSEAVSAALQGEQVFTSGLPGDQIVSAVPVFRGGTVDGALLVLAKRPAEVTSALQALRGERLTALALAVIVAALIGFLVASLITTRVKRLASSAGEMAEGNLDASMRPSGRDEIGDLGRALETMRIALAETFNTLSSERDRLSAILVSLEDAVVVVGSDGDVRFANPAAAELVQPDGRPVESLRPWIRRATHRGTIENDHVPVGDRVFAISARNLPAEGAALVVVRDRTEELRRDEAEREFVSNAAHELRNPIAGMSGAIEVLRSGAKDDPEARDRFLDRLAIDVDRVSRLTKSLLTLARMEATGEGEAEVVSVELAIEDAAGTVEPPEGVTLEIDFDEDLVARADPVLLRQVLIGLLTNAFKHTPAPGAVTLRAHRQGEGFVLIEVEDTGAGIPAAERDRVFERFYRGSGSLEREGFGLGLAIAKRMVDVMGGEIEVRSEEGRGSVFSIKLPLEAPSVAPVA